MCYCVNNGTGGYGYTVANCASSGSPTVYMCDMYAGSPTQTVIPVSDNVESTVRYFGTPNHSLITVRILLLSVTLITLEAAVF